MSFYILLLGMLPTVLIINGSASRRSANQQIIDYLQLLAKNQFRFVSVDLKSLPHFDPELSVANTPESILRLRESVEAAAKVFVCTPEYVFSIPSGLKNALEWCVATTIFTDKPVSFITASAHGQKGHEELGLIFKTLGAKFSDKDCLLIQGVKGKIHEETGLNEDLKRELEGFWKAFSRD